MSDISTTFTDDRTDYGKKTKGRYEVPQEVSIRIQAEAKRRGIRKDKLVEEILIKKFGYDRPS